MSTTPAKTLSPQELAKLESAFNSDPGSDAYRPLAEAYLAAGRFMEAMVVCKKGVKAHPNRPDPRLLLARVYAEQGKDKKALDELSSEGMKGLILDLRDDPGGLLSTAVEVADLFIDEGKIVSTKGRNTREKVYEAEEDGTFTGFPMVVLVNNHSASASEIVSACLQDHKRAKVVGQRSFGKGSVQNILPLDDGDSVLKLTVAAYVRPSGKNIHRFKNEPESKDWGVRPDSGLEVKLTDKEYAAWFQGRAERDLISSHNPARPKAEEPKEKGQPDTAFEDRQLAKALDVLKTKLDGDKATARK